MIAYETLGPDRAPAWQAMTYPAFRDLLRHRPEASRFSVIAARDGDEPVGLCLGRFDGEATGEILSVFVPGSWRRRGIGASLLEHTEAALRALGALRVEATYSSGARSAGAVESLLRRRGWSAPEARMLIGTADSKMLQAPWMQQSAPHDALTLFNWSDLAAAERSALFRDARLRSQEAFGGLPLADPDTFEPISSVGLRDGDRIVGWLLTHRVAPATIRYTHLYLESGHRAFGQALRLLSEGIRRQAAALGEASHAVFGVWAGNERMVRFTQRRLRPYLVSLAETRGSFKQLA